MGNPAQRRKTAILEHFAPGVRAVSNGGEHSGIGANLVVGVVDLLTDIAHNAHAEVVLDVALADAPVEDGCLPKARKERGEQG